MRYKKFKNAEIEVSQLAVGTWAIGGQNYGKVDKNEATQKEYVGTALVGVRSIEHADENCKTFDWKLTEEEMKILDSKIEECAL